MVLGEHYAVRGNAMVLGELEDGVLGAGRDGWEERKHSHSPSHSQMADSETTCILVDYTQYISCY